MLLQVKFSAEFGLVMDTRIIEKFYDTNRFFSSD